jgi:hypothetical protein
MKFKCLRYIIRTGFEGAALSFIRVMDFLDDSFTLLEPFSYLPFCIMIFQCENWLFLHSSGTNMHQSTLVASTHGCWIVHLGFVLLCITGDNFMTKRDFWNSVGITHDCQTMIQKQSFSSQFLFSWVTHRNTNNIIGEWQLVKFPSNLYLLFDVLQTIISFVTMINAGALTIATRMHTSKSFH